MTIAEPQPPGVEAVLVGGMYDGERVMLAGRVPDVIERPAYTQMQRLQLAGDGMLESAGPEVVEYLGQRRTRSSGCVFFVLKGATL